MRAAIYERTGPARDVLHFVEFPDPEPRAGEVRVELQWSGVNPSDVKTRGGVRPSDTSFPRIPHSDGMGFIDQVGHGVDPDRIGEAVWIWNGAWGRPFGTAAQYIVVPARQAVRLPQGVSGEAGACFGIPALTAMHAVLVDGGVKGKTVLVAGGAGAVGYYALQFARLLGAGKVIASVSTREKAELARAAGADEVFDYRREDFSDSVLDATRGEGVDRVIDVDIAANAKVNVAITRRGGDWVAYGSSAGLFSLPFFPLISSNIRVRFFMVYHLGQDDRATAVAHLHRLLEEDRVMHHIGLRLGFDDIVHAHELVEQGAVTGNVVLRIE